MLYSTSMKILERIQGVLDNTSPRAVLLALLLVSACYRVAFFAEQREGPLAKAHTLVNMDMTFFHEWAVRIAGGDILIDEPFHPYIEDQAPLARRVLAAKGWENGGKPGENPVKTLWDRWHNGKVFHQEPLYPYLLAAAYSLSGQNDPRIFYAFQMAAGMALIAMIYLLTLRQFGPAAAMAAGLLAVFYGPFLFYEFTLLRAPLSALAAAGLVYLAMIVMERDKPIWWAALGFASGIAILLRTNYFIFTLLALALAAWIWRERALRAVLFAALGILLALLPAMARNAAVGVNPLALAGNASFTFYGGNNPYFDPREGPVERWEDVYAVMAQTDGKLLPVILLTLKMHEGAGSYIMLLVKKLSAAFSWYEIPNNINFYYARSHSLALKLAPVTFFLIAPLAIAGIYLSAGSRKKPMLLWAMTGTILFTLILFFPLSRYRVPLAAVLIPFAGYALAEAFRSRRALAAAGLSAAVLWSASLPGANPPLMGVIDYSFAGRTMFLPRINEAQGREDWKTAAGIYKEWADYERDFGIDFNQPEGIQEDVLPPALATFRQYRNAAQKADEKAWAGEAGAKADILQKELNRRRERSAHGRR